MNYPVFDLHCDTALALLGRKPGSLKSLRRNEGHVDLERAGKLPGYAQCFACFTTTWNNLPSGMTVEDVFRAERDAILTEVEKNCDLIALAGSAEEVERNTSEGKMSAILTIEGPAGFGFDPQMLYPLYDQGFRISTLTWNEKNSLAGSHMTGGGLTQRGRDYVRIAQELGMLIDVSHLSDEAFWDLMDMTQAPVIASHSNSRSVWNVSRNLTDDMFRAIVRTDGVTGINMYTSFLGPDPVKLDTVCDHILHFLELDPSGKHISLGGDLDGCEALPNGFSGVDHYNALAEVLERRGIEPQMIHDLFWNNAMGVMTRAVRNNKIEV